MLEQQPDHKKALICALIVLILAAVFRFSYVNTMTVTGYNGGDAINYINLARNITNNGSYSVAYSAPFAPSFITPGYPLFLAGILKLFPEDGGFYPAVLNIQALLGALTALLFFRMALHVMPLLASLAVGLLVALSPHLVIGCGNILTENLFTFFLSLAFFLCLIAFERNRKLLFLLCGITFGLTALIRPAILLYPLLLLPILWKLYPPRQVAVAGLLIIAGTGLIWSGWTGWQKNHPATGEINLVAATFSLGMYPNLTYHNPKLRGYPYKEDPEYHSMSRDFGKALRVFRTRFDKEPWKYLAWYFFGKPATFWSPSVIAGRGGPFILQNLIVSMYSWESLPALTLFMMMQLQPLFVILAALSCFFALRSYIHEDKLTRGNIPLVLSAMFLLYFTAVHTVLAPLPRYSFPAYPFVFLMAVHFSLLTLNRFRRKNDEDCQGQPTPAIMK